MPDPRCGICGHDLASHAMGDAYDGDLRRCTGFVPMSNSHPPEETGDFGRSDVPSEADRPCLQH